MKLKNILSFLPVFIPGIMKADEIEMADMMRSNGKIYVVVAVMTIIFVGIILFLIRLDRKISRLEKSEKRNS